MECSIITMDVGLRFSSVVLYSWSNSSFLSLIYIRNFFVLLPRCSLVCCTLFHSLFPYPRRLRVSCISRVSRWLGDSTKAASGVPSSSNDFFDCPDPPELPVGRYIQQNSGTLHGTRFFSIFPVRNGCEVREVCTGSKRYLCWHLDEAFFALERVQSDRLIVSLPRDTQSLRRFLSKNLVRGTALETHYGSWGPSEIRLATRFWKRFWSFPTIWPNIYPNCLLLLVVGRIFWGLNACPFPPCSCSLAQRVMLCCCPVDAPHL